MTLDEFLNQKSVRNAYVEFPGFRSLYVRHAFRPIGAQLGPRHWEMYPTLDIANVEAEEPGKGAFKRLFRYLRADYPEVPLYVENVQTRQFEEGLERLGFKRMPVPTPEMPFSPSYYFLPEEAEKH